MLGLFYDGVETSLDGDVKLTNRKGAALTGIAKDKKHEIIENKRVLTKNG